MRPFGLRDLPAVHRLARQGLWLNLYHYLVQRRSPLLTALFAPVPWRGTGLASYVLQNGRSVRGFVLMLKRPSRPEADILYIAPGLEAGPGISLVWQELLGTCIASAGEHGVRRVFASLPEGSAEIDILAGLGFAVYSNEDVYRLSRRPRASVAAGQALIRPQTAQDAWGLRRLYNLYTPSPVQHAEGMVNRDEPTLMPLAWWELSQQRGYVLIEGAEVQGAVQVVSGRRGHWLVLHGDPGDGRRAGLLLEQGLQVMARSRWPVYCAVRDYQGGLRSLLQDRGFEPMTRRSRLVRHLAARVRMPEATPVPSLAFERSP